MELQVEKKDRKCLGMTTEIILSGTLIEVHNARLVGNALVCFGMQYCVPVVTPMVPNTQLQAAQGDLVRPKVPYRELLGIFLHLVNTCRPKIAYSGD